MMNALDRYEQEGSLANLCRACWQYRKERRHQVHEEAFLNFRSTEGAIYQAVMEIFSENRMLYKIARKNEKGFLGLFVPDNAIEAGDDYGKLFVYEAGQAMGHGTFQMAMTRREFDFKGWEWIKGELILEPNQSREKVVRFSNENVLDQKIIDFVSESNASHSLAKRNTKLRKFSKYEIPYAIPVVIRKVFVAFVWMVRNVTPHPAMVLDNLLSVNGEKYLLELFDEMVDNSVHGGQPAPTPECMDIFALTYAVVKYSFKIVMSSPHDVFDLSSYENQELQRKVNTYYDFFEASIERDLVSGFGLLIAGNEPTSLEYIIHDIIRNHKCFWVEHLQKWIRFETSGHELLHNRYPNVRDYGTRHWMSSVLVSRYYFIPGKFFELKLDVLNVGRLIRTDPRLFTSLRMYPGNLTIVEGMHVPDYSADHYSITSSEFMQEIKNYCRSVLGFVREHEGHVYLYDDSIVYAI